MKKNLLLIATFFSVGFSYSQVLDTVSLNAGYSNENYYKLSNDSEYTALRDNWDLAFATNTIVGSASTIRINGSVGIELYKYSNVIGDWTTLDTTGFNWSSSQLVNSDTSWTTGAFENTTPSNGFDLGWGAYSMITHTVQGDKIFILKLANGDYKKLAADRVGDTLERIVDDILGTDSSKKEVATKKYGPMENWDVSEVTDISYLFWKKETVNADLSKWDVSQVTSMSNSK